MRAKENVKMKCFFFQARFAPSSAGEVVISSPSEDGEIGGKNSKIKVSCFDLKLLHFHFSKGAEVSYRQELLKSKLAWSCNERSGRRRW